MPIYEYRCSKCQRLTSVWVRSMNDTVIPKCDQCGSTEVSRVMSKVAYHRSTERVWEESGPPSANPGDDYYKDPRNIGRWTEKRLEELGVDMPSEAREMIDAARDGDMPAPLDDL